MKYPGLESSNRPIIVSPCIHETSACVLWGWTQEKKRNDTNVRPKAKWVSLSHWSVSLSRSKSPSEKMGTERNTGDNWLWSDGKSMREMEWLWVVSTHMDEQRWVQSASVSVWLWHKRRKSDQNKFCTRKKKSNYSKWWYCKGDTRERRLEMKVLKFWWCLVTLMVTISVWTHPVATDEYGTSQVGMEASLILKSTSSGSWTTGTGLVY